MSEFVEMLLEVGLLVLIVMFIIFTPIAIVDYYSSCREAKIYNDRNNTNFSCGDFFWAEDQINTQTQTIKLDR